MEWSVYMVLCSDGSLYTGISTNVERRLRQHQTGKGAKFFRGRQALRIAYQEAGHNKASAASREWEIKRMTRRDKLLLMENARKTGFTQIS